MEEILNKVIAIDFPDRWPDLISGIICSIKNSPDLIGLRSPILVMALLVLSVDLA